MYRNTRFGDLMKGLSRSMFNKVIAKHGSDKFSKGFSSWDQLTAMVYAQMHGCKSLRDIETGFNSQSIHHYHLGTRSIKRSTLADANSKRSSDAFAELCTLLMATAHRKLKKEFYDLLYLIDSSSITLKGKGFDDWTAHNRTRHTQGIKIHVAIAEQSSVPLHMDITAPNVNDVEWAGKLPLEKGATYVFDKGYYHYNWWFKIHQSGARFVTRSKINISLKEHYDLVIAEDMQGIILKDSVVGFTNKRPGGQRINHYYGTALRRIVIARNDHETPLVLMTNDLESNAQEIAELYKKRWQIELFFKWIKQNLKIKKFIGNNQNAVKIQIYTAIISYLLLQAYHKAQRAIGSIKTCLITLQAGLFQRPELETYYKKRKRAQQERQLLQGSLAI